LAGCVDSVAGRVAGSLPLWFESSEPVPWWVEMFVPEGVEASVPLLFGSSVSDVVGAYWRRLNPGRVVVSVVRWAELSVAVWFALSASGSAPRRRRRVGWEALAVNTDSSAVPRQ